MAANLQWDAYANGSGVVLIKMMLNEREVDFKAECDGARYAAGSRYYDYARLKACHGRM
jgi:hypothetical protein